MRSLNDFSNLSNLDSLPSRKIFDEYLGLYNENESAAQD